MLLFIYSLKILFHLQFTVVNLWLTVSLEKWFTKGLTHGLPIQ